MQDNVWNEWVQLNGGGSGCKQRDAGKGGVKSKKKGKAALNTPKKNLSAYMLFCEAERAKKDLKGPGKAQGVELGRRWRVVSEEDKQRFIEKAASEKERYKEEMAAFSAMGQVAAAEEKGEEGGVASRQFEKEGAEEDAEGAEGAEEDEECSNVYLRVDVEFSGTFLDLALSTTTTMIQVKRRIAVRFEKDVSVLLLTCGEEIVRDHFLAGSYHGATLSVKEILRGEEEEQRQGTSGEALVEEELRRITSKVSLSEARMAKFMTLFHE